MYSRKFNFNCSTLTVENQIFIEDFLNLKHPGNEKIEIFSIIPDLTEVGKYSLSYFIDGKDEIQDAEISGLNAEKNTERVDLVAAFEAALETEKLHAKMLEREEENVKKKASIRATLAKLRAEVEAEIEAEDAEIDAEVEIELAAEERIDAILNDPEHQEWLSSSKNLNLNSAQLLEKEEQLRLQELETQELLKLQETELMKTQAKMTPLNSQIEGLEPISFKMQRRKRPSALVSEAGQNANSDDTTAKASPTVASPTVASPTVASPTVASSTVASPTVASPTVASTTTTTTTTTTGTEDGEFKKLAAENGSYFRKEARKLASKKTQLTGIDEFKKLAAKNGFRKEARKLASKKTQLTGINEFKKLAAKVGSGFRNQKKSAPKTSLFDRFVNEVGKIGALGGGLLGFGLGVAAAGVIAAVTIATGGGFVLAIAAGVYATFAFTATGVGLGGMMQSENPPRVTEVKDESATFTSTTRAMTRTLGSSTLGHSASAHVPARGDLFFTEEEEVLGEEDNLFFTEEDKKKVLSKENKNEPKSREELLALFAEDEVRLGFKNRLGFKKM
jgi:hypothetical protein